MSKTISILCATCALILTFSCSKDDPKKDSKKDPTGGVEAVDLGLPSGTKWASWNVGAKSETDCGSYFAWGETSVKTNYTWNTYKWGKQTESAPDYGMTKYKSKGPSTLEAVDDPATAAWGSKWRSPSLDEIKELLDNCDWTWTAKNGVNGYTVTSKTNSNNIFLPATGYRLGAEFLNAGEIGHYWSSSPHESHPYFAYIFSFKTSYHVSTVDYRCYGLPVRAVTE